MVMPMNGELQKVLLDTHLVLQLLYTSDLEFNYNVNEGSYAGSSTLYDLTSGGYNSTINGATYNAGSPSYLSLMVVMIHITTGRTFNLNNNTHYSFVVWIKLDSTAKCT